MKKTKGIIDNVNIEYETEYNDKEKKCYLEYDGNYC